MEFGERMKGLPQRKCGISKERSWTSQTLEAKDTNLSQLHEFLDFLFKQDTLLSIVFTDEILGWETGENPDFCGLKGDFWQVCVRIFPFCPQGNIH